MRKKEYSVCLDIFLSPDCAPTDSDLLEMGIPADKAKRGKNRKHELFLRIESGLPDTAMLNDHIDSLNSLMTSRAPVETDSRIRRVYLNVGVYFYGTVTCTVSLPAKALLPLLGKFPDIEMEFTCYPSAG